MPPPVAPVSPGTMDNRSGQVFEEARIKMLEVQPGPGLRAMDKRAGVESSMFDISQVILDAAEMGSEMQPSLTLGEPEKRSGHIDMSEEDSPAPRTQEQRHLAEAGKKKSSCPPPKGPRELQTGLDQTSAGSDPAALPTGAPAANKRLQNQGVEEEAEDQLGSPQSPRTLEAQATESFEGRACHPTPGPQAENGADVVQLTEPCCTLDCGGQQPRDRAPKETGAPQMRPQETPSEPEPGELENGSQDVTAPAPTAIQKEETADCCSLPTPGSHAVPLPDALLPSSGGKPVEPQPAPVPASPPVVKDSEEWRSLDDVQKQPQPPTLTTMAQSLKTTCQGFMKCLLEVEEEEAMIRRATKARALQNRKSPRTLTPMPTSTLAGNSAPSLPKPPNSAPATAPSWVRPPAPGPIPASIGALVPASSPDMSWRRMEFLQQNYERSLARPTECDESNLLKLFQNWKEKSEEHLTLRQEEGDGHVSFKDFLAVMTDTKRFFCSVEQNTLTDMAPSNPHTLFFEILSLLVEMLALPEAALEEITNYYQKKLKEGTTRVREIESTIGRLRPRKKLPYAQQQVENFDVPERRVLRILSRLKQQNYADNLQSPYAQVPCIPLCPRLDKKMVCRKQGSHHVLDQYPPTYLGPDIRSFFFQPGSQGSREHSSDGRKWLGSMLARTH
ncbi:spermatogenesis-associated protein 21 isoform X2 [Erinaceus europaeus]|uniref:Spermatogenesis-associated protein 21 isoform X2 n=1 Tax=Erinaceus europaeus TaxID=9365 RepID=A0ABM3Y715_ERIEU|nr:spermatogenesis-associated protein 21 isoform X2 [Erinaceus europaeus]